MAHITATALRKQFGLYHALAQRAPVIVTHHGRDSVVLVSVSEYERYRSMDDRRVVATSEMTADDIEAIAKAEPPAEAYDYDHEDPDS